MSGFIGRRLVPALVGSGAEVTVLTRDRRPSTPPGVRTVKIDLSDTSIVMTVLAGQDIVVHLAYDGHASFSANLQAFEVVLAAAEPGGASRFVHASSIVVYDDWLTSDLDKGSAFTKGGGSYRRSKVEMEERLMSGALRTAILQPTIVWGRGSTSWTDSLAASLLSGEIVLPEPEGICNGVFVKDVVQSNIAAALLPDFGQERFILKGPHSFTWSDLLVGYASALGLDAGAVTHVPRSVLEDRLRLVPTDDGCTERFSIMAHVGGALRRVFGRDRVEALKRSAR